MRIDVFTTYEELQELQPEWNSLLEQSNANTIFLTWEWISSWWMSYGNRKRLHVLAARENGCCHGIAPLFTEPHRSFGRPLRRLRFLGDGSYDSDYLDFIIRRDQEQEICNCFLEKIAEFDAWDVAQLNEVRQESPTARAIQERFATDRYFACAEVQCPVIELPATWDNYVRNLRPRFRTALRSGLRDVQQMPGAVETLVDVAELETWLDEFFYLHGDRWGIRNQKGVFASCEKRQFYRTLSKALLRRGSLLFTRWRIKSVAVAYQFGFVHAGCYFHLQEAFDPASAHIGPGISLRASVIRELIGTGITKYDFLGGTGRHKSDWGATPRLTQRFAIAPKTARGFFYIGLPAWTEERKDQVKATIPSLVLRLRNRPRIGHPVRPFRALVNVIESLHVRRLAVEALHSTGATALLQRISKKYQRRRNTLERRRDSKFIILNYHRVGTGGVPLYCNLSAELFEAHMRYLRANYPLVSLAEICECLNSGAKGHIGVAVTFDDGYIGTYTEALPVLEQYAIPATIYLPAGCIESGELGWYDKIFLQLMHFKGEKLDVLLDRPRRFELKDTESRLRKAEEIISYLRTCPDLERQEICEYLEKVAAVPPHESNHRMMTWDHAREMQAAGLNFGCHTMTHRVVSRLSAQEVDYELGASKSLIEARLGCAVLDFAFPFGKRGDRGLSKERIRAFGYRSAVTTESGANSQTSSPYELRRMLTGNDDESLASFVFRLNQLMLASSEVSWSRNELPTANAGEAHSQAAKARTN